MDKKPSRSPDPVELRRNAEERLRKHGPGSGAALTESDTRRLVHELQVHHIELEMQNEELQQARSETEAALEKYSDLFEFAPVPYLVLGRDGTIRAANQAAEVLLGVEPTRWSDRRVGQFVAAEDQGVLTEFFTRVFQTKVREFCEVTFLRDGKPPVEARIQAIVPASGRECRAAITDLTGHNRHEKDRLILQKLESNGFLAGGMAHDYGNLLTTILLNLELARTLTPVGEEFLGRRLVAAENAAILAQDLTRQLVTLSCEEASVRSATSLPAVIHAAAETVLAGYPVKVEGLKSEDPRTLDLDVAQISQVFRNILLNAREAMARGGVISIEMEDLFLPPGEQATQPVGDVVRISITDRGCGIAREILPRIFDPYFSTKQRGNRRGLGLGLTTCHAIIQRHGGSIGVDSKVGVGTTLRIHLPFFQNSASTVKGRATTPDRTSNGTWEEPESSANPFPSDTAVDTVREVEEDLQPRTRTTR